MNIHITTDEVNRAGLSTREALLGSAAIRAGALLEQALSLPLSHPDQRKILEEALVEYARTIDVLFNRRQPSGPDASKLKMIERLAKLQPPELNAGSGILDVDEAESYSFEVAAAVQEHLKLVNEKLPKSPCDRFDTLLEDALYDNVSEWEESRRMLRDQYEYRNETRAESARGLAGV